MYDLLQSHKYFVWTEGKKTEIVFTGLASHTKWSSDGSH